MKYSVALASLCVLLLSAGCTQSPEKLLSTANKYHANKKYEEASILYQKVILKDKTNAEAYYRQGLNLLDQGKIADAAGYLRRAVDLQPGNADAETKLAEIYLTAYAHDPKRYRALLPDVKDLDGKILSRDANSFNGLRLKALLQLTDKDYPGALATFEKANKVSPYSRLLVGWYAETLVGAGKQDEAIALVNDMIAHDKTWGQGYDFLFVQYGRTGQKDKTEAVLRERVTNDPTNPTAIENLSSYLLGSSRYPEAEQVMRRVLNDPKSFPMGRIMLGDFYVRAQKYDLALAQYQQGEKDNNSDKVKYQERVVALQSFTNHGDQAIQLAKQLADNNPKDLSANEMYASILLQSGTKADANKSLEELKKLVKNNPNDAVLHLDLARAYFSLSDRDKALAEAQEAISNETKAGQPRVTVVVPARTVVARILEDRGQHAKAMEQADLVLSVQPNNPDAILIKDRALIGTNEADKALPELEALVAQYPAMNDARLELATLYLGTRQFDKATAQFDAVNKATPPDIRGFIGLQTVKLSTGKVEEALQAMQELVEKNPSALPYRYQLANFQASAAAITMSSNPAHGKQLLQQAADNYKEILKTTANSVDVWMRLGVMQRQLGQYDASLASFEQAGNADPKSYDAYLNQALLLDALNRKKEAYDAYTKVLGVDPDNALALNNLAFIAADSGTNLDQAQTYAERAKKKAPDNADVSDTLGYVYYQKNLNGEALRIFRQNVQDHPNNPTFHFHLAMALLKQGDRQGAKEEATKALQGANAPDQLNKIKSFVNQIG